MFAQIYPRFINRVGEFNPQLFREIKGRLQPRNLVIVSALSIIGQVLLFAYFEGLLPLGEGVYNRYCTGVGYNQYSSARASCIVDYLGNVQIIKELWWLDLFTTMSIIGIFALLVGGSYMLIADVTKEEREGTFNFIRLSPQSATDIFVGKILGVPIFIYLFGFLAIPLHIWSGLSAHIPFPLIIGFYLVLGASCLFFYGVSLVLSLVTGGWGNFQAPLVGIFIFFFLFAMAGVTFEVYAPTFTETSIDWLLLFYPGVFLAYLVKSTFLSINTVGYLSAEALTNLHWYGKDLFGNAFTGGFFMVLNYGLWTFWLYKGLKRRFENPLATVISKPQSYCISLSFIIVNLGFSLQVFHEYHYFSDSLKVVQGLNLILFLLLIAGLTPSRQSLRDWARFRHQNSHDRRTLFQDLVFGEKSPAVVAIALNLLLVNLYIIPSLFLPINNNNNNAYSLIQLANGVLVIALYASMVQLLMTLKTKKRGLIAMGAVILMMVSPLSLALITNNNTEIITFLFPIPLMFDKNISLSLLSFNLIAQTIAVIASNVQITRVVNKVGMSETKRLMMSN